MDIMVVRELTGDVYFGEPKVISMHIHGVVSKWICSEVAMIEK